MEIIQIVSFALVASVLTIIVKEQKSSIAFFLILFTGIIIFLILIREIAEVFTLLEYIAQKANVNGMYVETILKIIGIAYVAEFGAQITRDAGLGSVASKIELAGKVFILVLAIPILTAVIETILGFLPA
ncbi:stage III sporulation protein AD [Pontibacillus chungwhensis BH030062]|uniref:Stage III sporulation protein AD n=2 Tax=Pontibacillus TaxID=289201 RepID=A0A0A2VE57_9BACI|nr:MULTISPECIES: stage III sporulation protein AD [Pontibacillus]KGP91925.1 stage III sporulation protein AD [Pontibacillus chungwhensis BH030062]GGD21263.1 stage III sporulation protein AD [Pontibacillus salipaludis]